MTGKHFSAMALTGFILAAFVLAQPMAATALAQSTPATYILAQPMAATAPAQQQKQQEDKSKRPSPPGTADCTINGKKVTIDYSRPYLKGRKLGTDLAPYGKVWRTGA